MLVYVFIKLTYPTSDVTTFAESAVYICKFLQITSELKEIVCYSKRPIGLLFHALSHETMFFNFIALNGTMTFVIIYQKDRY